MPARFLAVLTASVVIAAPAVATTVLERSLPEMSTHSGLIVRGTVIDQQAAWVEDHSAIETTIRLRIRQILKGGNVAKSGDVISIVQPGGVVEERGQLVPGAARFKDGEDVILFLEPSPVRAGGWILERLAASKFAVSTDAKGTVHAVRDVSDLAFAVRGPDGRATVSPIEPRASFTLDEIRSAVKAAQQKAK